MRLTLFLRPIGPQHKLLRALLLRSFPKTQPVNEDRSNQDFTNPDCTNPDCRRTIEDYGTESVIVWLLVSLPEVAVTVTV
jgi:hypothetical protein